MFLQIFLFIITITVLGIIYSELQFMQKKILEIQNLLDFMHTEHLYEREGDLSRQLAELVEKRKGKEGEIK
jgi:hypothetical protein